MPGLVLCRRRWSVASDDFVFPTLVLLLLHVTWLCVVTVVLAVADSDDGQTPCISDLHKHAVIYIVILVCCIIVESLMLKTSMKGSILEVESRKGLEKLVYVRILLLVVEMISLVLGVMWINDNYNRCIKNSFAENAILGITITNWIVLIAVFLTILCSFVCTNPHDLTPHSSNRYVKRRGRRKSEIERNWIKRCRMLICCLNSTDRNHGSLGHVVKILSTCFEDMDLVPSDIAAGLVILRKLQQMHRHLLVRDPRNPIIDFLSGVAVTAETQFLDVNNEEDIEMIHDLIHYMRYCLCSYGWPVAVMSNSHSCFHLCPFLRCTASCCASADQQSHPISFSGDNLCHCNEATFNHLFRSSDCELLYANYKVQIGEPSFSLAIDHEKRSIVITIRGTRSLEDLITDLNADADVLPLNPRQSDWLGHRGMIEAAEYVRGQLVSLGLLESAFMHCTERGSSSYRLVLVGHSLGAGVASILAILMRSMYKNLHCYAFSPPGGLLSEAAALSCQRFITSVVVGKDVVPRLGLQQMKVIQKDILAALSFCSEPKWKVIAGSCCCLWPTGSSSKDEQVCQAVEFWNRRNRNESHEEEDVCCSLFPPGKLLHVVRTHSQQQTVDQEHQALWTTNLDYGEILISPAMLRDHLPHNVMTALQSLLTRSKLQGHPHAPSYAEAEVYTFPAEPIYTSIALAPNYCGSGGRTPTPDSLDTIFTQKLVVETSFTDLRPSSLAGESDYAKSSIYSKPSFLNALRHHKKMDLFRHDWIRSAPLASPENVSLNSSYISQVPRPVIQKQEKEQKGLEHSHSEVSMQELIDVFSEGSDTRSLEEMVHDAKNVLCKEHTIDFTV